MFWIVISGSVSSLKAFDCRWKCPSGKVLRKVVAMGSAVSNSEQEPTWWSNVRVKTVERVASVADELKSTKRGCMYVRRPSH